MEKTKEGYRIYLEEVMNYLEYIGYPDLLMYFEPVEVATSMARTIKIFYLDDLGSHRLAALIIYGMTWEYQVVPHVMKMKVN